MREDVGIVHFFRVKYMRRPRRVNGKSTGDVSVQVYGRAKTNSFHFGERIECSSQTARIQRLPRRLTPSGGVQSIDLKTGI